MSKPARAALAVEGRQDYRSLPAPHSPWRHPCQCFDGRYWPPFSWPSCPRLPRPARSIGPTTAPVRRTGRSRSTRRSTRWPPLQGRPKPSSWSAGTDFQYSPSHSRHRAGLVDRGHDCRHGVGAVGDVRSGGRVLRLRADPSFGWVGVPRTTNHGVQHVRDRLRQAPVLGRQRTRPRALSVRVRKEPPVNGTPEPATFAITGVGLVAIGMAKLRRRRA